jgi:hypothetical protein
MIADLHRVLAHEKCNTFELLYKTKFQNSFRVVHKYRLLPRCYTKHVKPVSYVICTISYSDDCLLSPCVNFQSNKFLENGKRYGCIVYNKLLYAHLHLHIYNYCKNVSACQRVTVHCTEHVFNSHRLHFPHFTAPPLPRLSDDPQFEELCITTFILSWFDFTCYQNVRIFSHCYLMSD